MKLTCVDSHVFDEGQVWRKWNSLISTVLDFWEQLSKGVNKAEFCGLFLVVPDLLKSQKKENPRDCKVWPKLLARSSGSTMTLQKRNKTKVFLLNSTIRYVLQTQLQASPDVQVHWVFLGGPEALSFFGGAWGKHVTPELFPFCSTCGIWGVLHGWWVQKKSWPKQVCALLA